MTYESILFESSDGVATVTLNRPDKLNAFTAAMLTELRDAIAAAEADPQIRAVLITGAGRGFSAGQDLSDRIMGDDGEAPDLGETLDSYYNPLVRAMRTISKPVVVAVNGVAAGAGANIALAGDVVLAAESARFIQSFSRIGLIPDSGGTWVLPRLVGRARALGLSLFADSVDATTARDIGLIWDVVPDERLMEEALDIAKRFATGPTAGYGLIKQAIDAAADNDLDAQLDLERDLQRRAGHSRDYAEGVRAFLEKRQASFTGE